MGATRVVQETHWTEADCRVLDIVSGVIALFSFVCTFVLKDLHPLRDLLFYVWGEETPGFLCSDV